MHYVLVHGGGHGAWCWEEVIPLLRANGQLVSAPDLPALGNDRTPVEAVTPALCSDVIVAELDRLNAPAVLVGHSLGGTVISEAAERRPESVLGLIYVTAALVPPGRTFFEIAGDQIGSVASRMRVSDDGLVTVVAPGDAIEIFYNRTPPDLARKAAARLRPNPTALARSPLVATMERWGSLPRAYIECAHDALMPLRLQRMLHTALPCDPVVTMESDHSPFFGAPKELSNHLVSIASGWQNAAQERGGS